MQDAGDVAYLFLDTNIILHYQAFHSIPWPQLTGKPVCLMFAIAVIDELDKKKYEASQHLRERARSMLPKIVAAAQGQLTLPKDTQAQLYIVEQVDWERYGLDRTSNDDRLMGQILRFKEEPGHEDVRIVTGDMGMWLRVQRVGVPTLHLPDAYLLPVPDEVQSLKRELARLKNRMPKLTLGFRSGNKIVPHLDVVMEPVPPLTPQRIDKMLRMVRRQHPRGIFGDITEYERRYRVFLEKEREWDQAKARTVELHLVLENTGTAPAEDLDVILYLPRVGPVSGDFPDPPEPPNPPRPRGLYPVSVASLVGIAPMGRIPDVNGFEWSDAEVIGEQIKVCCSLGTVKHGLQYDLPALYVTFRTEDEIGPFQVSYELLAANLLQKVSGKLHVVPEIKGASGEPSIGFMPKDDDIAT